MVGDGETATPIAMTTAVGTATTAMTIAASSCVKPAWSLDRRWGGPEPGRGEDRSSVNRTYSG